MTPHFFSCAVRWILLGVWLSSALVAAEVKRRFSVEPGDATETLPRFAEQADREIIFSPAAVRGIKTNAISGEYLPDEALTLLLARTALVATQDTASGAISVRKQVRSAATRTAGTIEGRVFNARSGAIAENARVSIEGSSLVTSTD